MSLDDCHISYLKARIRVGKLNILRCSYEKDEINKKHRKSKRLLPKDHVYSEKIKINQGGDTEIQKTMDKSPQCSLILMLFSFGEYKEKVKLKH